MQEEVLAMDGRAGELKEKMDRLLKQAAEVAAELQALEQGPGVPHYSQIEGASHRLGRELSCRIQARRMGEVTSQAALEADCPSCGQTCEMRRQRRTALVDGWTGGGVGTERFLSPLSAVFFSPA